MASQKPRQSNSDDESTRASRQGVLKAPADSQTPNDTDGTKNINSATTTTGEIQPRSWYGGGSWPRIKSNPSIQIVKESIMAGKSGNNSRPAEVALFEQRPPAEPQPSKATVSRPASMDPGKSKETLKLVSGEPSIKDTARDTYDTANGQITHSVKPTDDQSKSTDTVVEPQPDNLKPEPDNVVGQQKGTGWLEWLRPTKAEHDVQYGSAATEETVPSVDEPQQPPNKVPSSVDKTKPQPPLASTVATDPRQNAETGQHRRTEPNTRWPGLWPVSNSTITVARPEENNSEQEPIKPDLTMSKDNEQSSNATTTGSSWAFWSRQVPSATSQTTNSDEMGEIAVTGEPSQDHPVAAPSNGPKTAKSGPELPTKTTAVTSSSSTKSIAPNLLLPSFRNTYHLAESPSIIQQIARLFRSHQPPTNHLFVIKDPPKIKKAIAIGIHGLFPATLLRTVIGQPTGTSIRFANHGASAIGRWAEKLGIQCDIEKIALEGEGKIAERVDHLWKLLLNWVEHVRQADFILVSCHSQGVPVAMMLTAKLINLGVVTSAKIGVCAMAGVSLGPFTDYKSRLFSGSAAELFDFADPDSDVSRSYHESLSVALKYGVRVTYVGSIDDQLVSLESAVFSPVDHPYIYRSVFVDGRIHAPDFITNLVGFALKLRNLGVSDHQLIKSLSAPLAGSLYSGEGHSRLYDEEAIYDLSVQFALETTSVSQNIDLKVQRSAANSSSNPFQLPWSMRGLLEEDVVKTELDQEAKELLLQFEEWKPTTKVLKDVKYELVFKKDSFDPVEEILGVIKDFTDFFLDNEKAKPFVDPDTGIIRRLERARNLGSLEGFKSALVDYNSAVESLRNGEDIATILDKKHSVSESLVVRIMAQTYDRAVSPKVDLLRKYENGTNEIYGELKSNLVYTILAETKITSKQVFVDLGSGVANVVLQAALQVGCESWGCEIMENACSIAEAQKAEFEVRCRLWGLQPGLTRLERGDFMVNEEIRAALQRADVVLVNNEVFTPELNVSLVNLFLDLKEGCKIVSLKSFVPENRKISNYNNNDPSNILDVAKKAYSTKSVSWKDEGGNYYISTKDSTRLQLYGDRS
ncbi:hypothetical protein VE02_08900 [Pseudogymnoascus sp. 03VT05]|nr:hypothetical protein VE02_08900 [Pseudogymnoascus sp. 03VT05]